MTSGIRALRHKAAQPASLDRCATEHRLFLFKLQVRNSRYLGSRLSACLSPLSLLAGHIARVFLGDAVTPCLGKLNHQRFVIEGEVLHVAQGISGCSFVLEDDPCLAAQFGTCTSHRSEASYGEIMHQVHNDRKTRHSADTFMEFGISLTGRVHRAMRELSLQSGLDERTIKESSSPRRAMMSTILPN